MLILSIPFCWKGDCVYQNIRNTVTLSYLWRTTSVTLDKHTPQYDVNPGRREARQQEYGCRQFNVHISELNLMLHIYIHSHYLQLKIVFSPPILTFVFPWNPFESLFLKNLSIHTQLGHVISHKSTNENTHKHQFAKQHCTTYTPNTCNKKLRKCMYLCRLHQC